MPRPAPKSLAANALRGFAMGTADLVPGVSGGTIALLVGIYSQFIGTIAQLTSAATQLLRGRFAKCASLLKETAWDFCLPLLAGIIAAVFSLAPLMSWLLENHPEKLAGVFCGVVLASTTIFWQPNSTATHATRNTALTPPKQPPPHNPPNPQLPSWARWLISAAVAAGLFVLLGLSSEPHSELPLLAFLGAGALAICAMVLPGISGAFLLLVIGMYEPVIEAISHREITQLLVFAAGAAVGLAGFAPLLKRCLDSAPQITNAVLLGLLLGSFRVLWPWPHGVGVVARDHTETIDGTQLAWPSWSQAWLPAALGLGFFAIIWWLLHRQASQRTTAATGQ